MNQINWKSVTSLIACIGILLILQGCASVQTQRAGLGPVIRWSKIENWHQDHHADAWPALLKNCLAMHKKTKWDVICKAAIKLGVPTDSQAKAFFEEWFTAHRLYGENGKTNGLITGYYEPLLYGSTNPSETYAYPIYQRPPSLIEVDLSELHPTLKNQRVRGRLDGNKIIPYYSRAEIERDRALLAGYELLWLDNREDVFFLHIQGSGRVQLDSGETVHVGYSNHNGHPYTSIGRVLIDNKELKQKDISLASIRKWLDGHPDETQTLLNKNASYVFFTLRKNQSGPLGSLNIPLTAKRSLAIDPTTVPLGSPIWLSTHYPNNPEKQLNKLVFAQDSGGAIKGWVRADLFWGHGEQAKLAAGYMKSKGNIVVLKPH